MPDNIEQRLVFAYSPNGTGDGVPLVVIGLPAGAWEYMRDGKTNHLDLSKVGVNVKLVLFGGESHDAVKKVIEQAAFARGEAVLDERQRDFSIEPKPKKPRGITRDADFPVEVANLMAMFNRCADGSSSQAVLNASLQMVSAAIGFIARAKNYQLTDAETFTGHVSETLLASVRDNWGREAKPTDVAVTPS